MTNDKSTGTHRYRIEVITHGLNLDAFVVGLMNRNQNGSGIGLCEGLRDMEWIYSSKEERDREFERVRPSLEQIPGVVSVKCKESKVE